MRAFGLTILNSMRVARSMGLDVDSLFVGLSFTEQDLEKGQPWVPWAEAALLFNRLEPLLDEASIEVLVHRHMVEHPFSRLLAQLVGSTHTWIDLFIKLSQPVNPMMALDYVQGPGEDVLHAQLHPGLAPCRLWFELSHHAMRFMLLPIGGPPLETLSVECSDTHLRSRFRSPRDVFSPDERCRASELPLSTIFESLDLLGGHLGAALRDGHLAFDPSVRSHVNDVATLAEAWGLTPSEARVTLSLGEGRSPAEVAEALGMAVGTARVHLRSVYSKTETTGQRELVARLKAWRLT